MLIKESQGYSKKEAYEAAGMDVEFDLLRNATIAWKKAGSPMGTKELQKFMEGYLKKNKSLGAYLVIDPSSPDTRLRPYNVINEVTKGKRKYTSVYQIKEGKFKVSYKEVENEDGELVKEVEKVVVEETGVVVGRADKKQDALNLMKDLIELNKRPYIMETVKEVSEGQRYAAYGEYVPSKSAKVGKFVFFTQG